MRGQVHHLGSLKIGQFDWPSGQTRPALPDEFDTLDRKAFFSLGQDADYYVRLTNLGEAGQKILTALADIVFHKELLALSQSERVTHRSLLRSVSLKEIIGQFSRILDGGARLTPYSFIYNTPTQIRDQPVNSFQLEFDVVPSSTPPTNVHVLIGKNGVGKSHLLSRMARALVQPNQADTDGSFSVKDLLDDPQGLPSFANVLSVSFSAFDEFPTMQTQSDASGISYTNIGLRRGDRIDPSPRVASMSSEFASSASACRAPGRIRRWQTALETLRTDSLFDEQGILELINFSEARRGDFAREAERVFGVLSSGHKVVLLTITKLVELLEEKTLVLMDEPECHLHPPLLSAFVRALSELLTNRNGVAIIATHSPVVLQEVPARCVWSIIRHGNYASAHRLEQETFGENVGLLTRAVFGLEVTKSGFHKLLQEAVVNAWSLEQVLSMFDGSIGLEGRALVAAMLAEKNIKQS
jgi:predicted ATPase